MRKIIISIVVGIIVGIIKAFALPTGEPFTQLGEYLIGAVFGLMAFSLGIIIIGKNAGE